MALINDKLFAHSPVESVLKPNPAVTQFHSSSRVGGRDLEWGKDSFHVYFGRKLDFHVCHACPLALCWRKTIRRLIARDAKSRVETSTLRSRLPRARRGLRDIPPLPVQHCSEPRAPGDAQLAVLNDVSRTR